MKNGLFCIWCGQELHDRRTKFCSKSHQYSWWNIKRQERYRTDPIFREHVKTYTRLHNRKKYWKNPEYRRRMLEYQKKKYRQDPEFRRRKMEYDKRRNARQRLTTVQG